MESGQNDRFRTVAVLLAYQVIRPESALSAPFVHDSLL